MEKIEPKFELNVAESKQLMIALYLLFQEEKITEVHHELSDLLLRVENWLVEHWE